MTEREIQDYIWQNRGNWKDLLGDISFPTSESYEDDTSIEQLSAEQLIYSGVIKRLKRTYEEIKDLELFGVEVPLVKEGESTMRADFLGWQPGAPGIAIVELKKSAQTEREAFTELLGYSNHINTLFPTHSKDDTILILITPLKVRTVKEAFLQTLLFDRKRAFIFTLEFENPDNVESLKLKPYIPKYKDVVRVTEVAFDKKNFDVRVIVWEDVPDFWNTSFVEDPTKRMDPTDRQKALMNRVSSMAAQLMEEKQINGFVYTSHSWPERDLPFPNSIVLVGLNPYKIARDLHYIEEFPDVKRSEISFSDNSELNPNLSDIVKGLKSDRNKEMHSNENYLSWLILDWESHLYEIGNQVLDIVNLNVDGEHISRDKGSMSWDQFETNLGENVYCFNYDVVPTGLIRELYWETTRIDYNYLAKHGKHPIHEDIFGWAIETLISHTFFSDFLDRMFGDPFGLRKLFGDDPESD